MKPNFKVSKQTTSTGQSSKILTPSHLVPKHMRCPRGSVLIKRIQDEDLALQKYSSFSGMKFSTTNSVTAASNYDAPPGYQVRGNDRIPIKFIQLSLFIISNP